MSPGRPNRGTTAKTETWLWRHGSATAHFATDAYPSLTLTERAAKTKKRPDDSPASFIRPHRSPFPPLASPLPASRRRDIRTNPFSCNRSLGSSSDRATRASLLKFAVVLRRPAACFDLGGRRPHLRTLRTGECRAPRQRRIQDGTECRLHTSRAFLIRSLRSRRRGNGQ